MRHKFSNWAHQRVRSEKWSYKGRPVFEYRFNGEFGYWLRKLAVRLEFLGHWND